MPSRLLDLGRSAVDVRRVGESKAEMLDAPGFASVLFRALEDQDVACTRSLGLEEAVAAKLGDHAEYGRVEVERAIDVGDGKGEMGEPERSDHGSMGVRAARRREANGQFPSSYPQRSTNSTSGTRPDRYLVIRPPSDSNTMRSVESAGEVGFTVRY